MKGNKIIFGLFWEVWQQWARHCNTHARQGPDPSRCPGTEEDNGDPLRQRQLQEDRENFSVMCITAQVSQIRADKREIRRDRRELGQDLRERRLDRRELHYDLR